MIPCSLAMAFNSETVLELRSLSAFVSAALGSTAFASALGAGASFAGLHESVVGVTGTDGKTTTVNLLRSIFRAADCRTGMISTVNAQIGDRYQDTGLHVTTPDAIPTQAMLAEMRDAGTEVVLLHEGRMLASGMPQDIMATIPGSVRDVARR